MLVPRQSIFICHASADKQRFVAQLAGDLDGFGHDVWLDEWEMRPGDSLRKRLSEGIDSCLYFCVVLSLRSVASPWVKWELDAATVREIEGSGTVVPIIYGRLQHSKVPVDLRAKRYVRFPAASGGRYERALAELEDFLDLGKARWALCHEVDLLSPRLESAKIETTWWMQIINRLGQTEIKTKYSLVLSGFTLENRGGSSLFIRSPRYDITVERFPAAAMYLDRRRVVAAGHLSGSPRVPPTAYTGRAIVSGEHVFPTHWSLRQFSRFPAGRMVDGIISPQFVLREGQRLPVGLLLGEASTLVVAETGELIGADGDGVVDPISLDAYVDKSCKAMVSKAASALSALMLACPLVIEDGSYRETGYIVQANRQLFTDVVEVGVRSTSEDMDRDYGSPRRIA